MTRTIGLGPIGSAGGAVFSVNGKTGGVVLTASDVGAMAPADVTSVDGSVSVTPSGSGVDLASQWTRQQFSDFNTTTVVTSNPPASAISFLTLDDGAAGDIVLDATKSWQLTGSVFFIVSASSTSIYLGFEYNISGGGWVVFGTPVVDRIGVAGGATAETGVGDLPPFMLGVPIQLRLVVARNGGPGGSTITAERGKAILEIKA